jgi:hypothetical protein
MPVFCETIFVSDTIFISFGMTSVLKNILTVVLNPVQVHYYYNHRLTLYKIHLRLFIKSILCFSTVIKVAH